MPHPHPPEPPSAKVMLPFTQLYPADEPAGVQAHFMLAAASPPKAHAPVTPVPVSQLPKYVKLQADLPEQHASALVPVPHMFHASQLPPMHEFKLISNPLEQTAPAQDRSSLKSTSIGLS